MRVRVHPAFLLYIGANLLFSSWQSCAAVLIALIVHELGHYIASRMMGERMDSLEITPFGGVMTYLPGAGASKGLRGLAIASAGPLGNYLLILMASISAIRDTLGADFTKELISANLVMLILNLIPALPLDGGRMLFSVGYYFMRIASLVAFLCGLGILVGIGMLLFSVYGIMVYQLLNCSIVLIGIYLIVCAARCRTVMLAENLFAVVQEKLAETDAIRPMTLIRVAWDTRLYTLLEPIQRAKHCCFIYENERGELNIIEEGALCRAMLVEPEARISQLEGSLSLIQKSVLE